MRRSQRAAHAAIWTAIAIILPTMLLAVLAARPDPATAPPPVRLDAPGKG